MAVTQLITQVLKSGVQIQPTPRSIGLTSIRVPSVFFFTLIISEIHKTAQGSSNPKQNSGAERWPQAAIHLYCVCLACVGFLKGWDQLLMFMNWWFHAGLTALRGWLEFRTWGPSQVGHLLCGLLPTHLTCLLYLHLVLRWKEKFTFLNDAEMGRPVPK